jgi:hypothetical protein
MELKARRELEVLNNRLLSLYGRHIASDNQLFRVVWAPSQLEKRKRLIDDEGRDIINGPILEIPKYYWMGNQYVVERLQENERQDVFEGSYIYECLYAFPEGLPLNWEAINRCCKIALEIIPKDDRPRTEKEARYQDDQKKEKEKQAFKNLIDTTPLDTALHDKNALSYSNTKGIDYRPSQLGENPYVPEDYKHRIDNLQKKEN